jgi:hypothetical protein
MCLTCTSLQAVVLTMPAKLFGPASVERIAADLVFPVLLPAYGLLIVGAALVHATSSTRRYVHCLIPVVLYVH